MSSRGMPSWPPWWTRGLVDLGCGPADGLAGVSEGDAADCAEADEAADLSPGGRWVVVVVGAGAGACRGRTVPGLIPRPCTFAPNAGGGGGGGAAAAAAAAAPWLHPVVEGRAAGRGSHDSQGTQASVVTALGTGLQAPGLGHVEGSTERRHLTPEIGRAPA
ncbi:hypothetical protein PCL_06051 [Purpureocillium lilacinum]|uniref:Uncharacterized protein n=2 Tax=Purpureocillium lilacinum TaxID=33203 RepID=A0A2U3ELM7_PURLI|nr:hypothetical protein Purlil1_5753 [Purpureocillium lilacinum]PWI75393.1 hypothetical protein PCL_06051 [Purpureocillium lilacinum]